MKRANQAGGERGAGWRRRAARLALAAAAAAITLAAAELASRFLDPHPDVMPPSIWQGRPAGAEVYAYVSDPELGYRPLLGNEHYSEHGTLPNHYALEKPPGVSRLLFLGDSVARQVFLQIELQESCSGAPIEIWTAAVEGYNTVQEVAYYLRYSREVRPDHLTLLFHNNDFLATPVVYADPSGDLRVSIGEASLSRLDRALLARSNLYRHFFKRRLRSLVRRDPVTTAAETRAALVELQRALEHDGTRLSVVLLPILEPFDRWTRREKRHRELALGIFEELELDHFDLLEPLEAALAEGVPVAEAPGDSWHPSRRVSRRFLDYLLARGYLGFALDPAGCEAADPGTDG